MGIALVREFAIINVVVLVVASKVKSMPFITHAFYFLHFVITPTSMSNLKLKSASITTTIFHCTSTFVPRSYTFSNGSGGFTTTNAHINGDINSNILQSKLEFPWRIVRLGVIVRLLYLYLYVSRTRTRLSGFTRCRRRRGPVDVYGWNLYCVWR